MGRVGRGCGWGTIQMFKSAGKAAICCLVLVLLSACAATKTLQNESAIDPAHKPSGPVSVLIMPVDIELSELTAGGALIPKADWTQRAKTSVANAQRGILESRQAALVDLPAEAEAFERDHLVTQTIKLHGAVGYSVLRHANIRGSALPSKRDAFDWTLGKEVTALGAEYDADYALFVFLRDSFSSDSRKGLMVLGAVMGIGIPGGQQVGFASLVDLETGQLVWFRQMRKGFGDLRDPASAQEALETLYADIPL